MYKLILFVLLVLPFSSYSAIVVKIKNNKTFVHLEGEEAVPGDLYKALDLYGKPKGILRIKKVRNGKAIATIIEGRAGINWILEKTSNASLSGARSPASIFSASKNMVGVLGGSYLYAGNVENNQLIIRGFAGDVSIFAERFFTPYFSTRLLLGFSYSQLNQSCRLTSRNCTGKKGTLNKLSAPNALVTTFLHANISNGIKAFFGVGVGVSKWTDLRDYGDTIIKKNSFKELQSSAHLSLGLNVQINPRLYIPISLTYTQIQFLTKQFEELIRGRSDSQDHVSLGHFALQVGVATEF